MVPVTISESASSASQDACSGGGGGPINGGCGGDPGGRLTGNGSDGHTQFLYEIYPNPNNCRFAISYTAEAESSVRMELVGRYGQNPYSKQRAAWLPVSTN